VMEQSTVAAISKQLDENEVNGAMFKIKNDPRVTRVAVAFNIEQRQ